MIASFVYRATKPASRKSVKDADRAKRDKRSRSANEEKFRRDVRGRNMQDTFDKPLACVAGIFDHVFSKPVTRIADKFVYTFDPLSTANKGVSKVTLDTPFTGVRR